MPSPTANKTELLIASAEADRDWAQQLREGLRQRGLSARLAEEDLTPRTDWAEAIREALKQSSHVVFLVTRGTSRSPLLLFELGVALAGKKRIIPVVAVDGPPDDLPAPLRSRHSFQKRDPRKIAREIADAVAD